MISASPRRLSVFKQVVETGGFNAAAAELGIAQPSVCAHVKALESQLGQPLFYRHRGSRPKLTKAGEALYGFALDMLRKSEEATHALAHIRSSEAREITIAVHRDVAQSFLPAPLGAFTRKHPGTRIVTRIGTIEEVLELLRDEVADLGLLVSSGPPGGVTSVVLRREPLWLVAMPGHPLARRKAIQPAELAKFPFVTGLSHSRYQQMVDAALRRMGIPSWQVAMELQESAALKGMVGQGAGIACLLRCAVEKEIEAGALALLDVKAPAQELELRCVHRAPLRPPLASFLDHLRSYA
ncbi:MAG TPA: LysR family transcriptional regulator [Xanthobacteraceae bacterium]|nr:LysR family transcriptional regulator [Xanthobacteraceae bacterium]